MTIDSLNMPHSFSSTAPQSLVADPNALANLQARLKEDPQGAAREVATHFESLFLEMMMRTMRETRFDDEVHSSEQDMWHGLLDQQFAQAMSASGGIGLADALVREIRRLSHLDEQGEDEAPLKFAPVSSARSVRALQAYEAARTDAAPVTSAAATPRHFVQSMLGHAKEAASQLGVAPELIIAHAALESGWGKRAIRHSDGRDSYNVFGIKAGAGWQGQTVNVLTTEYVNGVPQKQQETFRAYGSYQEAFTDYANMLLAAPRYRNVLNQGQNMEGFAQHLQHSGYATDPNYAKKLVSVWSSLDKA